MALGQSHQVGPSCGSLLHRRASYKKNVPAILQDPPPPHSAAFTLNICFQITMSLNFSVKFFEEHITLKITVAVPCETKPASPIPQVCLLPLPLCPRCSHAPPLTPACPQWSNRIPSVVLGKIVTEYLFNSKLLKHAPSLFTKQLTRIQLTPRTMKAHRYLVTKVFMEAVFRAVWWLPS